jgi:hypothetical protein
MKTFSWSLMLAACLLLAAGAEAQKKGKAQPKLYRWVDENGEVHFSETVPPGLQDENNQLQKKAGGGWQKDGALAPPPAPKPKPKPKPMGKNELPRDSSGLPRPKPRFTPAQVRAQQDALLLLRYDSDKEILDAMQVEIKQLDYDKRVLNTSRKSLMQAYNGNIREAAERQRAGIKVENKLSQQVQALKQRLTSNQRELDSLKAREKSIRTTFEAELERYRMLAAAQAEAEN